MPILGIRLAWTPDTLVDVFIVAIIFYIALFLLCLPPVAESGTQPLHQLTRHRRHNNATSSQTSSQASLTTSHVARAKVEEDMMFHATRVVMLRLLPC